MPDAARVLLDVGLAPDVDGQTFSLARRLRHGQQRRFWALDPIHKAIESKAGDQRLYYERRPGQFNTIAGIEKVRIVTKDLLLKMYASDKAEAG